MSTLDTLLSLTAEVKRKIVNEERKEELSTLGTIRCHIQPISEKSQMFNESAFGREYKMYCRSGFDFLVGDRVISNNIEYSVSAFSDWRDYSGEGEHFYKLIITKADTNKKDV